MLIWIYDVKENNKSHPAFKKEASYSVIFENGKCYAIGDDCMLHPLSLNQFKVNRRRLEKVAEGFLNRFNEWVTTEWITTGNF